MPSAGAGEHILAAGPPRFNLRTVGERVAQVGDLFQPVLLVQQDLRRPAAQLMGMLQGD